jgi:hypothetical protein
MALLGGKRRQGGAKAAPAAPIRRAFVLMPFDQAFDDVYQLGIREACRSAGWDCSRVDEHVFSGLVLERIYEEVTSADLIIADMTGRNPNVFYEVGYAHALSKRVVLLTRTAGDIPFDLRGHRHIVYEGSIAKLQRELTRELSFILSENPLKDFKLNNLSLYTLQSSKERSVAVDNFISLDGGHPVPLLNDISIQVPGEISNYGKGIYFDFALCLRNASKSTIDLSDTSWRVSFPKDVFLADDSLRLGHGKLTKPPNDHSLILSSEFAGTKLDPSAVYTLMFHFRSAAVKDGQYLMRLPLQIAILRQAEWFSIEAFVEFAPLRRMN